MKKTKLNDTQKKAIRWMEEYYEAQITWDSNLLKHLLQVDGKSFSRIEEPEAILLEKLAEDDTRIIIAQYKHEAEWHGPYAALTFNQEDQWNNCCISLAQNEHLLRMVSAALGARLELPADPDAKEPETSKKD